MDASAAAVAPAGIAPAGRRLEPAPVRAGGLQLLGELAGSGYREAPALVRRGDGQLIKLTPLLYELIDAIDGRRGHAELAAELSSRIGRRAAPDDVRFLIERKLRPLGLLAGDDQQPEIQRSNPLLALRPRVVVSRPELTRRLTAPFVWLFKPIVMLPALLAFAALGSWLLVEKGLASALHQAFYEPGLILIIWGLVVLSMAFHEVGHAAACRYGGARPGVMGAGLYLIWPAFYTEVSDSYRLSRRGRLRVDLGGLYFSAIFALATAGLWHLTGTDALLLVIAVQLIQMVRQLVPFIRADGYHIVADLIGVPDLFAHIKPTLLGLLPARFGGRRHEALKPWARAVVTTWVLITVPALLAVLAVIVLAFPRLAATAWDSLGLRWAETTAYWGAGDLPGIAMSAISMILVALPVLSITYLVAYLARRVALRVWRDTAGRPRLRALAVFAGAALLALVGWAWWPDKYQPVDPREAGTVPTVLAAPTPEPVVEEPSLPAAPLAFSSGAPVPVIGAVYSPDAGWTPLPADGGVPGPQLPPPPDEGNGGDTEFPLDPPGAGDAGLGGAEPLGPAGDVPAPGGDDVETASGAGTDVLGPGPEPAQPEDSLEWPFPFDPPDATEPGDNRAMTVNTQDGSKSWDVAFSVVVVEGEEGAYPVNEALAFASCTDCVTGAIAFQVVMLIGTIEEIVPINTAIAANYQCSGCDTYAFAYQIVVTVEEPPGPDVLAALADAWRRLQELEAGIGSLTPEAIYLELESIEAGVLDALAGILAVESTGSTAAGPPGGTAIDEEIDPTDTVAPSITPTSGAGPEAEPTELDPTDGAGAGSTAEGGEDAGAGQPLADESPAGSPPAGSAGDEPAAPAPGQEPAAESPPSEPSTETGAGEPTADGQAGETAPENETTSPAPCDETAETSTGECPDEADTAPSSAATPAETP